MQKLQWKRAKRCGSSGCVEVAQDDDVFLVRDSKNPGALLTFDRDEWAAFVDGAKGGEFDPS